MFVSWCGNETSWSKSTVLFVFEFICLVGFALRKCNGAPCCFFFCFLFFCNRGVQTNTDGVRANALVLVDQGQAPGCDLNARNHCTLEMDFQASSSLTHTPPFAHFSNVFVQLKPVKLWFNTGSSAKALETSSRGWQHLCSVRI